MQINYPSHHQWLKDISAGFEIDFSGSVAEKIRTTIPRLEAAGVSYTIEPLTAEFLCDFMPMYEAEISAKPNAQVHDVPGNTLYNPEAKFPYFCFSLKENGVFVGGSIFSVRSDCVAFAYRAFSSGWITTTLRASPSLIGEYGVAQYASAQGKKYLSHGKDRNPYGLNASIGLATFKLSVGCSPSVRDGSYEVHTIDTDTLDTDCLILELPKEGSSIIKAYLVTLPKTEINYIRVTKYPKLLEVTVIHRT